MPLRPTPKSAASSDTSRKRRRVGPANELTESLRQDVDFQRVFDHFPEPQAVVDEEGRILAANTAACRLTGFEAAELTYLGIQDLVSSEGRAAVRENLGRAMKENHQSNVNVMIRRKCRDRQAVELRLTPIAADRCLAIFREPLPVDAEIVQLQYVLDRFAELAELGGVVVLSVDSRGLICNWNSAAERMFGYSLAEAVGMPLVRLIPTRLRSHCAEGFFSRMKDSDSNASIRIQSSHALRRNETEFPVSLVVTVRGYGRTAFATAIVQDRTEQESTVECLHDVLQQLEFHVQCMPLAYIVWDRDFRVVEWNPAAEQLFGYARTEAIGLQPQAIFAFNSLSSIEEVLSELNQGNPSIHSIHDNIRRDGSRLACEWFAGAIRDSAGLVHGVASMARDVTDREFLEARLRDAHKLESLGVLASGVAHDFNSLLMLIQGNTSLLRASKTRSRKAIGYLDAIEEASQRSSHLVKHLLAYARTGRHNPQTTNLNDVICECLNFVQSSLRKDHYIRAELADDLPVIMADCGQIEQVILNLCLNSKQAMPQGGEIAVTTRRVKLDAARAAQCVPCDARPGEKVELAVKDLGCGMDPATAARIFDPFFTTKTDGHGLGLAAVLGILRQHQAAAFVETGPDRGTTMRIYFPIQPGSGENDAHA